MYWVDPNPQQGSIPLRQIGSGQGSGSANFSTPLQIEPGIHGIAITYFGENDDAEFTMEIHCQTEDGEVYSEQKVTFRWGDGLPQSPPFATTRTFNFYLPPNCEISSGGATDG